MDLGKAKALFPAVACKLESPDGPINYLIGMDHMRNAPKEQGREDGIVLYRSEFNTGYMACGDIKQVEANRAQENSEPRVLSCCSTLFNPPEFIPARGYGDRTATEMPSLQELQRMPVPYGQPVIQREH
jgi:hypothetical protein